MSQQQKFLKAVKRGDVSTLESLLGDERINVNGGARDGLAPLLLSIRNEDITTTTLLLEDRRIDVNVEEKESKWTPLSYSVAGGEATVEILKLLLSCDNVDINHRDKSGRTVLHQAAVDNLASQLQLLIDHKIQLDAKDANGQTALHIAVCQSNIEAVQILLENNANIYETDKEGNTPIHLAVTENNPNVVKMLLNWMKTTGVDFTKVKDTSGNTALHAAVENDLSSIVDLLISYGYNMNEPNNEGITPAAIKVRVAEQTETVKHLKAQAVAKQKELKREVNKVDQQGTEVYSFCKANGLSDAIADALYAKHFRFTDEAFLSIDEEMLLSMHLSFTDVDQFMKAQSRFLSSIEEEAKALLKLRESKRRALQRKNVMTALLSLAIIFAAIYLYFAMKTASH